jgi:hypothetical protein
MPAVLICRSVVKRYEGGKVEGANFLFEMAVRGGLLKTKSVSPLHPAAGSRIAGSDADDVSRHCLVQLPERDLLIVGK